MVRAAVDLRERGPVPKRERRVGEDSDTAGQTKPSNSWCASAWSAADCVSVWNARVAASGSRTWRAAATSSCRLDWLRCKAGGGGGDASTNKLSRDSLWPVLRRRPSAFVARNRHRSAASAIGSRRPAPSTTWQPGSHRRSCTSFWSSSPRAWRIVATMTSVLSSSSASSSAGRSTAVGSNLRADQIWNVRI